MASRAWLLLADFEPHLVLTDIRMPGMGGLQLCVELRKEPRFSKIPFIFMTAFSENVAPTRSITRDDDEIVLKPIDPDQLKQLVSRMLESAG